MKRLLIVFLLGLGPTKLVYADNCYVHEKGSDSWYDCKDQARQNERLNDQLNQNLRDVGAANAQASANDSLAEQQNQQIRALLLLNGLEQPPQSKQ